MSISEDAKELDSYINEKVDIESVASFKGNEHIVKLTKELARYRRLLDSAYSGHSSSSNSPSSEVADGRQKPALILRVAIVVPDFVQSAPTTHSVHTPVVGSMY